MCARCCRQVGSALLRFDAIQRRRHNVYEFSDGSYCILRLGLRRAEEERELGDGTVVKPGDLIAEIHFWNEQIPRIPDEGCSMRWGIRFYDAALRSLLDLAKHVRETEALEGLVAVYGETAFATVTRRDGLEAFLRRLGFEFATVHPPRLFGRIERFFVNLYAWLLIMGVNPASLKARSIFTVDCAQVWMSRDTLLGRYAAPTTSIHSAGRAAVRTAVPTQLPAHEEAPRITTGEPARAAAAGTGLHIS